MIATTSKADDDCIVELIEGHDKKVMTFRGSEEDVLDRYYKAITNLFPDFRDEEIIVRVTSDCPLIDYDVVDTHIEEFFKSGVDYLSSRITKRTWPHGMEAEVFSFNALRRAWERASESFEREHVTPFIYKTHPNEFRIKELPYPENLSYIRLTVDYPEDFELIKAIMQSKVYQQSYMHLSDILEFIKCNPSLLEINKDRVDPSI